ncbi:Cadherin-3 [Portunus trituberculatus]|uniref:Cadherin-3 n=1 Tax=Portunus trituberculatus TaxID=210409 RepID=A0A5B7E9S0_PORTR|nr:Cadherin-3 [Portunus trituberculatus]
MLPELPERLCACLRVLPAGHSRVTTYWVTVQDLNDVPPVFDRSMGVYEVQLPENREVGKPTGIRLAVDDADEVNEFTFDIISGNEGRKFSIDETSRTIVVAAPLDYDYPVNDRNPRPEYECLAGWRHFGLLSPFTLQAPRQDTLRQRGVVYGLTAALTTGGGLCLALQKQFSHKDYFFPLSSPVLGFAVGHVSPRLTWRGPALPSSVPPVSQQPDGHGMKRTPVYSVDYNVTSQ